MSRKKINILYVITKLELGGAQSQLLSLVRNLDRTKFNLFLFTAKKGLLIKDAAGLNTLTLRKSVWLERKINPLKDIITIIEIYWFIKRNAIDIVHTHSSKAGILGRIVAKLTRVKIVVHTVHGWSFNNYQPAFLKVVFIWLERLAAKFTNKIIVVSDFDRQLGLKSKIGNNNKYVLIRYGINYGDFSRATVNTKREFGIENKDLVVGMISCFKPQKSPQDFIKAAFLVTKSLPDVKFILAGDGILRNRVKALVDKYDLQNRVILLGWRRDIPHILSSIDIFALTSLWEGLPIAVLEAMASGKPVVATRTGGVAEVIKEGETGFLVSPGDVEGLSEKLAILLNDEALRRKIGQNAKDFLDGNFCLERLAKNTHNLYNVLIREEELGRA